MNTFPLSAYGLMLFCVVCGALASCSKKEDELAPPPAFECHAVAVDPQDEPSQLSRLRAVGSKIVDNTCRQVILKGVAIIDPYFIAAYEGGFERFDFRALKNEWRVNVVRVPIHPDLYEHEPSYLEKYVDPIVEQGNALGFYVFLGYHAHGNAATGRSEQPTWRNAAPWHGNPYNSDPVLARRALREITQRYHRKPWVFYGSFNEPAYISWHQWRPEAEKLVDVIHQIAPNALVTVSGINWGYDLSGVLSAPVRRNNVVYETHPYPWKGNDWQEYLPEIIKRYPVMVGEWGFGKDRGQGTKENYALPLLKFCKAHQIGRIAWVWHHQWTPSTFQHAYGTLTEFGEVVKDDLRNKE